MERIDLSSLAHIAEIVAAIGVIVSLIYVAIELRANTAAVRATTAQSITASSRDFLMDIALDEEFSRIRSLGQRDLSSLTDLEAERFTTYARGDWLYFQNMWIQWTLGAVDDRVWGSVERILCQFLDDPGNRADWPHHRDALDPEFVALVERCSGLQ